LECSLKSTVRQIVGRYGTAQTLCGSKSRRVNCGIALAALPPLIVLAGAIAFRGKTRSLHRPAGQPDGVSSGSGAMTARLLLFITAVLAVPAAGQDTGCHSGDHGCGHRESHDWYQELRQPGTGYSCCNGSSDGREGDCRPTRAYLHEDGHWRAVLAPDGGSHVCAGKGGTIYCFIAGVPKS
jgi:hypothetical protein